MTRLNRDIDLTEILVKAVFVFCFLAIFTGIAWGIFNETNRISEGVVIDKSYSPAYTTTSTVHRGERTFAVPEYHAASYSIKLQGEKDGETVTYWRNITEQEYHEVDVGDYYPPKGED